MTWICCNNNDRNKILVDTEMIIDRDEILVDTEMINDN